VAHVDHGKTTLVDAMLRQTGAFRPDQQVRQRVMDSSDLERERGITIFAKQAAVEWEGIRINLIDTPGHADFGGEVERTLRMADGALLLVDAAEGPLPQTRFVLGKALELGMRVVVVINKIDRQDARPGEVLDEVFDLFCELGAHEDQLDFPTLYAIGKDGLAKRSMEEEGKDLRPLFETIVETVAAPEVELDAPLRMLVHDTQHDEYVGRLAIGRVVSGRVAEGQTIALMGEGGTGPAKIGNLWAYENVARVRIPSAQAGDIIAVSGIDRVAIGDTLADVARPVALERISVEEPTIRIHFRVNDSPFSGRSGKFVTSRQLRERLFREAERNPALRVEETDEADAFQVLGRGELMLAVFAETMRREGYELALGMPQVVTREIDGQLCEPWERVVVDVPEDYVGAVTTNLGKRKGRMEKMTNLGPTRVRVEFRVPSRGLIGFRTRFLTETRGTGLLNTLFDGWEPWAGPMQHRANGAIVADRQGRTTPYALFNLQPRGLLFIGSGIDVYEGMIVGEHNRANDLDVNATREKKLTNIRAAGKDENVVLSPPKDISIDSALEWVDHDELVEVTPAAIRIRKRVLPGNRRPRRDAV